MLNAQIDPKKFGEGATEKTEPSYNYDGATHTTTIVKDKCGKLRQSRTTSVMETTKLGPNFRHIKVIYRETKFTEYDCNERPIFTSTKKTENGVEYDYIDATYYYDKWGDKYQTDGVKRETDKDGKVKTKKYDPKEKAYLTVSALPENNETNLASEMPPASDCPCDPQTANCGYRAEAFVGYSYLSGQFGNDKEGFPAGGHASVLYNLNSHVSTGINASFHSKKNGIQTLSRSFVMIEGRFVFQDMKECERNFFMDVHVLVGLGSEKLKYSAGSSTYTSKGSGPAFGAGLSGIINITKKAGIKAEADYIGIKFKNSDDLNGNFRASLGFLIRFGG